ncbi:Uncharacterised protein [Mycobacteroides abscessus subsp. abscessus]|nr:Uncharacterised protein [Mycobacteroides abscessus subsp. abscessus]
MNGQVRRGAVRETRCEVGQPARHGIIEPDELIADEPQHRGSHDRLGHRGKPEQRVLAHRQGSFAIRETMGAAVLDLAVTCDDCHGAHDPAFPQCGAKDLVKTFCKCGIATHGETLGSRGLHGPADLGAQLGILRRAA